MPAFGEKLRHGCRSGRLQVCFVIPPAKVAKLADAPDLGNEKTGFQSVSKPFTTNVDCQSKYGNCAINSRFPEGE
jgi:hypothetical protein